MSDNDTNLKLLFKEESAKLGELIELTEYILNAIQNGDKRKAVASLLSTRESILREIMGYEDSVIAELQKTGNNISYLEKKFPDELEFVRGAVLRVRSLDEELAGKLQEQKEEIIEELKQIKVGQILPDRYKKHENGGPSFVNIKE